MRLLITFCVGAMFTSVASGQTDSTDENYSPFKNPVLKGTTILTESPSIIASKNLGYFFTSISASECGGEITQHAPQDSVKKISFKGDTLTIEVKIQSNCCYSFLGEILVRNDTLNLIYHGYGSYCFCECCFGLTYEMGIMRSLLKNGGAKYVMINGNRKTARKLNPG